MHIPPNDPLFSRQGYLSEAPVGISVAAAWENRADGFGITVVDLERGWNLSHQDLPAGVPLLNGVIRPGSVFHGTGVLGILAGVHNNGKGIAGIAPNTTIKIISDHLSGLTGDEPLSELDALQQETADMIEQALRHLSFGDVLLVEVSYGGVPAEIDARIRDNIREATQRGIIVVEPAGNDDEDLDEFRDVFGNRIFNRTQPGEFEDSGAIIVGAASSSHPHVRWIGSKNRTSFGTRVDCYAWGEDIVTAGSILRPTRNDAYFDGTDIGFEFFGGTSGAAAIIAGVCVLVQNLQTNPVLVPLSGVSGKFGPDAMRRLLRKVGNGTESLFPDDRIGIMPDFNKILANEYAPIPIL